MLSMSHGIDENIEDSVLVSHQIDQVEFENAIQHVQEDINSDDIYLNFKARVFAYSVGMRIDAGVVSFGGKFKSERAFAKETGIPHSTAYKVFNEYKQILKSKLKV